MRPGSRRYLEVATQGADCKQGLPKLVPGLRSWPMSITPDPSFPTVLQAMLLLVNGRKAGSLKGDKKAAGWYWSYFLVLCRRAPLGSSAPNDGECWNIAEDV